MSDRKTLYVLYALAFLATLGYGIMIPSLSVHAHNAGASNSAIGVIVSAFAAAQLLTQIPMGRLADRMGRVYFAVTGFAIMAVAATLYNAASSATTFIALQALAGVGAGCLWPPLMAMLADASPVNERGKVMGTFNTLFYLGVGLGPLVGGFIAGAFGALAVFNVWAAVALCGAALCVVALRDSARHKAEVAARRGAPKPDVPMIRPGFWTTFVAGCMVRSRGGVCTSFNNALLPLYVVAVFQATPEMIGGLMFIHGVCLAVFNYPGGVMSDRYGRRLPAVVGSFVATVGVLWYSAANGYWEFFVAVALAGAGAALSSPAINALTADICEPRRRGEAFGYVLTSFNLGMVLGALVFGFVSDLLGLWGAVFTWGITSFVLSLSGFAIREAGTRRPAEVPAQARA